MTVLSRQGLPPDLQTRLRRLAMVVRVLIAIGAISLVAATLWVWVVPGHAHSQIKEVADVDVDQMALHTQVIGGLWTLLPLGIMLLGLQRLWRLFGEYAKGCVFSHRALVSLRGFARCVLATGFVSPLYGGVLSVIVTFDRLPGTRQLNVSLSSNDYAMILIGAVLLAISTVMAEAARVAEDNAGFV
ncbi:MAG: DUF2975 domain-containing protein [Burkholderiaceae bacterium]|jgi:hypothetical protein